MIYPEYDQDIFSQDIILNPYPHYRAIRDLGPVVHLTATDVLTIGRYDDVKAVLANHTDFLSGKGTALNAPTNEMVSGTTLMSDAPRHTKMKKVLMRPLNARALQDFQERLQNAADDLVDYLVEKGEFDGVAELAHHLPVSIISWLVGIPEEGRQNMLKWSAAGINLIGPMNELSKRDLLITKEIVQFAQSMTNRQNVVPGSWADGIFDAVDEGLIEPEMAPMLIIDFLAPSLDNTIFATGWLLLLLAQNPEQWEILKQDPSLNQLHPASHDSTCKQH